MKIISTILVIVVLGIVVAASICAPEYLAANDFLRNFINHEVLNILAVIMTVTAASGANIHLAFNRAEELAKHAGLFNDARSEINHSVLLLIALFAATIILLIVRSFFLENLVAISFFNGIVLWILLVNVIVLLDLTLAIFEIHPMMNQDDSNGT